MGKSDPEIISIYLYSILYLNIKEICRDMIKTCLVVLHLIMSISEVEDGGRGVLQEANMERVSALCCEDSISHCQMERKGKRTLSPKWSLEAGEAIQMEFSWHLQKGMQHCQHFDLSPVGPMQTFVLLDIKRTCQCNLELLCLKQ